MLRGASLSIYSSLTTIFNASLRLGRVPSAWKNSNVTPIFKSGDAGLALNNRPISLLSLVSKVRERQVHDVIQQHLLEHDCVGLSRKEKDRDEKTKGDKEKKTEKHRDVGGA